jgi:hypothetical protein
LDRIARS